VRPPEVMKQGGKVVVIEPFLQAPNSREQRYERIATISRWPRTEVFGIRWFGPSLLKAELAAKVDESG